VKLLRDVGLVLLVIIGCYAVWMVTMMWALVAFWFIPLSRASGATAAPSVATWICWIVLPPLFAALLIWLARRAWRSRQARRGGWDEPYDAGG
jgi:magnesium-transporting ATPase (P-type)